MQIQEQHILVNNQTYLLSTDKGKLDIDAIADYLIHQSYWATTRTFEQVRNSIEHSLCFAVYYENNQIAFGRVISDYTTFAYLADVFVLENHRKQGISKALMHFILMHPNLQNLRRFMLATKDSHGLYSQFGFKALYWPERWMEVYSPTKDDLNR